VFPSGKTSKRADALPIVENALIFRLDQLPKTIWMEVKSKSMSLQDIHLKWIYGAAHDHVRATGVWADMEVATDARHDNGDTAWADTTDPQPKDSIDFFGGFGLRPIDAIPGVKNVIAFRYVVTPPGIQTIPRVAFDVTRQVEGKAWVDGVEDLNMRRTFPTHDEEANDDRNNSEESNTPAFATRALFGFDAPGFTTNASNGLTSLVLRLNFREFVRISLNGVKPTGNVVYGSRGSLKYRWHVRHRWRDNGGVWIRVNGADAPTGLNEDQFNDIGPDHITVGDAP